MTLPPVSYPYLYISLAQQLLTAAGASKRLGAFIHQESERGQLHMTLSLTVACINHTLPKISKDRAIGQYSDPLTHNMHS